MDERLLTEKLVGYDSSSAEGIKLCAGFVKGWLQARDIGTSELEVRGLPVLLADVGPPHGAPTVLLHGHLDVVPGRAEQFEPRLEGERLYGRGAYDMKGALAALMLALADLRDQGRGRGRFGVVPHEGSQEGRGRRGGLPLRFGV